MGTNFFRHLHFSKFISQACEVWDNMQSELQFDFLHKLKIMKVYRELQVGLYSASLLLLSEPWLYCLTIDGGVPLL